MSVMKILSKISKRRSSSTPPPAFLFTGKNVVRHPDSTANADYAAFGCILKTGEDTLTYLTRIGTNHLTNGKHYRFDYTISTGTWGSRSLFDDDPRDMRDIYGEVMDNGEVVVFSCLKATVEPLETGFLYMRKAPDTNMVFGPRIRLIGGDTGHTELWSNFVFGKPSKGDNPGEYYIGMCRIPRTGNRIISCLKTTDYFNTWTIHDIYTGTAAYSETSVAYLGGGRLICFIRFDNGGPLSVYESSDSAVTWNGAPGKAYNLSWYGFKVIISHPFMYEGKLNIIYQDRDSHHIVISRNNDPDVFFGNPVLLNKPDLWAYNLGASNGNPSLGYPTVQHIQDGVFMVVYTREESATSADLYYSLDDFVTENSLPLTPPAIESNTPSTTGFRIEITGYEFADLNNIKYFEMDVATSSDFTTFHTMKYRHPSLYAAELMQNIRMFAVWATFSQLTSATSYYIRVRACNNLGKSGYQFITVVTA